MDVSKQEIIKQEEKSRYKNKRQREKKRRKYFKLRKNRSGFAFMMFLLTSVFSAAALALMISVFMFFTVTSCIENEYDSKTVLAELYESGVTSEGDPYSVFDKADMDYIIRDKSGSIIYQNGENTCSSKSGIYERSYSENGSVEHDRILFYLDSNNDIISVDKEGDVDFDEILFVKSIISYMKEHPIKDSNWVYEVPVWVSVNMDDIGQELVFKAAVSVRSRSVGTAIAVLIALGIIFGFLILTMLMELISSIADRIKIGKLFFRDMKINAKNWLWFHFTAEQLLRTLKASRKNYALIDLELAAYRRYCVCNSIDEGEELLKNVYDRLKKLTSSKELCAHNNEGSFALLLEYADSEALKVRIEGIIAELEKEVPAGTAFHAGIFLMDSKSRRSRDIDIESDFTYACAACVSLEGNDGSAVAFYDDKLVEEQRWKDTVAQIQQKALDNEEFLVYYQPKYDPRTHELRGAEALVRWQSPEYGFLPPYKFIPIFEKNGFITEIDHYMLSHAARDQKKLLDRGLKCVPVSVNISRAHFIEPDLAEQIKDTVDREGCPRELIEIELTESAFFDDKKAMILTISRLKSYGISVSMDDFGSGYSSLNSLKDMPLDVLKLDADFFRGEEAGTKRGEIVVSEAIRLAKSLNMRTVAEGVEVREQAEFLAAQGCDMIQGYYFAKPMPGADFEEAVRIGRKDPNGDEPPVAVNLTKPKDPVPVPAT